jgi:hypothetical protein
MKSGADVMRYRKEFGIRQLAGSFAGMFICSILFMKRSLLTSAYCGVIAALVMFQFYFFRYWEIRDDCLIQRFFFRRIVFPFSEIRYVGPMKGEASNHKFFAEIALVETVNGKRMYIEAADPEAFLSDMRKHLPAITLNL